MSKQWIKVAALLASLYVLAWIAMLVRLATLPETDAPTANPPTHPLGFGPLPPEMREAFQNGFLIAVGVSAAMAVLFVVAVAVEIAKLLLNRRRARKLGPKTCSDPTH